MERCLVAVPSTLPGGLEANIGEHFGHCDIYTLVEIEGSAVKSVTTLPNVPHVQGGCMAPVQHLAGNGVKALVAGGMGLRPLMGFKQTGIEVFHNGGAATVGQAIQALLAGRLQPFSTEFTCGGHS